MAPALIIPIGLGAFLSFVFLYAATHTSQTWLVSLLHALSHPQGSIFKQVAFKALSLVTSGILYIVRSVDHAMSTVAAHSLPMVARWFDGLAAWITWTQTASANFAVEVANGFDRLVTHTIPRAVTKAIAVPLHEVRIGLRHTQHELELLRRYARGIDRLVRDTIWPALRRIAHAVDVTLPRSLGRVRARVGAAERAISRPTNRWIKAVWRRGWILVGAGLMVRFLAKKFPYLFCRNSTNALKAVCGMDTSLLTALLAGTAALNEVNLRDFCRTLQAIEDEIVSEIQGFVTLGD